MDTSSNRPPARRPVVVEAATLKDALRQVRIRYGEDARVIRSRTLVRRQRAGLGTEKVVEVLVEPTGTVRNRAGQPTATGGAPSRPGGQVAAEIAAEVARIEALVRQLSRDHEKLAAARPALPANPLAETLLDAGAGAEVVSRFFARLQAETGAAAGDRTAALDYLSQTLTAGTGRWQDVAGCHVLLGPAGAGKTELTLAAAAKLQSQGRQVLVLELLPRHGGEIRRLQAEAARHGYDAAIIQKPEQLPACTAHFAQYDAVLIDTPGWEGRALSGAPGLRQHVMTDPAFHRHLVLPLDTDLRDARGTLAAARDWNCDWTALVRLDRTRRHGKVLDVLDRLPLPVSWLAQGPWPGGGVDLASSSGLVDLVLAAATDDADADEWSATA